MNEHIRQRLLVESTLTFNEAVKIAVSMELASNQMKSMAGEGDLGVEKMTARNTQKHVFHKSKQIQPGKDGKKDTCVRCGGSWDPDHLEHCRAKEAKCNKCGTLGHYARVCQKKQNRHANHVQEVQLSATEEEKEECQCVLCVANVNSIHVVNIKRSSLKKSLYKIRK